MSALAVIALLLSVFGILVTFSIIEGSGLWGVLLLVSIAASILPSISKKTRQKSNYRGRTLEIVAIIIGGFDFYGYIFYQPQISIYIGFLAWGIGGILYACVKKPYIDTVKIQERTAENTDFPKKKWVDEYRWIIIAGFFAGVLGGFIFDGIDFIEDVLTIDGILFFLFSWACFVTMHILARLVRKLSMKTTKIPTLRVEIIGLLVISIVICFVTDFDDEIVVLLSYGPIYYLALSLCSWFVKYSIYEIRTMQKGKAENIEKKSEGIAATNNSPQEVFTHEKAKDINERNEIKFCRFCGHALTAGSDICPMCGKSIRSENFVGNENDTASFYDKQLTIENRGDIEDNQCREIIPEVGNVRERLLEYKKMLDDGLISEDDYEAKKKQILGI